MTSVFASSGTLIENLPSTSVATPKVVPSKITVAPIIGSLSFSEITRPFTTSCFSSSAFTVLFLRLSTTIRSSFI